MYQNVRMRAYVDLFIFAFIAQTFCIKLDLGIRVCVRCEYMSVRQLMRTNG